jgi:membrane-associated phospholipid phosphatase
MRERFKNIQIHSLYIVAVLIVSLAGGSVAIGYLVQKNPLFNQFDRFFYELIHHGPHFKWLDILIYPFNFNFLPHNFIPIGNNMPSYLYIYVFIFLIYIFIFKRKQFSWALAAIIIGTAIAGIITALDWHFVYRARPFTTLPNTVDQVGLNAWKDWSSFPSGHARETALYSTLIVYFIPALTIPLIIFSIFIAYSRVYLGAHYPTDVLSGLLIGLLAGYTTVLIIKELKKIHKNTEGIVEEVQDNANEKI